MGTFDYYRPTNPLECPICHAPLTEWFGEDGPHAWLIWQQGVAAPVDQSTNEAIKLTPSRREQFRLPPNFRICSYDCDVHCVKAECSAPDGTWKDIRITEVLDLKSLLLANVTTEEYPNDQKPGREVIVESLDLNLRTKIESLLHAYRDALLTCGATVSECLIDTPASLAEVAGIEQELGRSLPPSLKKFATSVSRRISFDWSLPEAFPLPQRLQSIFTGGLNYDISEVPEHEFEREGWQKSVFPVATNPYDAIWHNKIAFHHVMNGDYLALDPSGRVIYLSHDDGQGHGYVMAQSFADLMLNWTRLGCPGPEDWQWLPFTVDRESGIDPDCEAANDWRRALQLKS